MAASDRRQLEADHDSPCAELLQLQRTVGEMMITIGSKLDRLSDGQSRLGDQIRDFDRAISDPRTGLEIRIHDIEGWKERVNIGAREMRYLARGTAGAVLAMAVKYLSGL